MFHPAARSGHRRLSRASGAAGVVLAVLAAAPAAGAAAGAEGSPAIPAAERPSAGPAPTFARDVAPILYTNCVPCHRPGQVAPFALLTYRDAAKHARQIAMVTASRYMPPWKPEPGYGEFRDARLLSDEAIGVLARWAAAGAPQGDPSELPPAPHFASGWQLGAPDLVVTMPEPYEVPADGNDIFRNFVLPVGATEDRWIRAVELRVGNPRLVHHATMLLDPNGTARLLDAKDSEVGFAGMLWSGEIAPPDGHFLGWTPGRMPRPLPDGTYWKLARGDDLVLETHVLPSGKPEELTLSAGLYFAASPPTRHPMVLRLGTEALDIPAGAKGYVAEDELALPAPIELIKVYPHAHYLCRQVEAWAELPDGRREWLIKIGSWDFNWQDSYEYVEPLVLPANTRLHLRLTYDNSEDNYANPHHPPERVRWGPKSSDEMGDLWLQALPVDPGDRGTLESAAARHVDDIVLAGQELRLRLEPGDPDAELVVADLLVRRGELQDAVDHYEAALAARPGSLAAHNNLAGVLLRLGRHGEAEAHYRETLRLDPTAAQPLVNLASALAAEGRLDAAEASLREALARDPSHVEAHLNLGTALTDQGHPEEALPHLEQALGTRPDSAEAHYDLGNALASLGRRREAMEHYREALRLRPKYPSAHNNLGTLLAMEGSLDEAAEQFRQALRDWPQHPDAHANLGSILARQGALDEALAHLAAAIEARPAPAARLAEVGSTHFRAGRYVHAIAYQAAALRQEPSRFDSQVEIGLSWQRLGRGERAVPYLQAVLQRRPAERRARAALAWILATDPDPAVRDGHRALMLASPLEGSADPAELSSLAAAYAETGDFGAATETATAALAASRQGLDEDLTARLVAQLDRYRSGRPFRQPRP